MYGSDAGCSLQPTGLLSQFAPLAVRLFQVSAGLCISACRYWSPLLGTRVWSLVCWCRRRMPQRRVARTGVRLMRPH